MKVTITTKETKEVEIPTPVFWRRTDGIELRAILSDNDYREIYNRPDFLFIKSGNPAISISLIQEAYNNWELISELEFMTAWDDAFEKLSLTTKLIEK
jgi:pilus assembly protein TadC